MKLFLRAQSALPVMFLITILAGCGKRSEPEIEISRLSRREAPSAIVKNEKPKHYDQDGVLLSDITFTWEMPREYVPPGIVRLDVTVLLGITLVSTRLCDLREVREHGPVFGGLVYECTVLMHPDRHVIGFDFSIIVSHKTDPGASTIALLEPATWPEGVMPTGSKRFGSIKLTKGDEWSSTCTATEAIQPTDCTLYHVSSELGWIIGIDSVP